MSLTGHNAQPVSVINQPTDGTGAVRDYRLYPVRKDGHIAGPPAEISADNDVSAVKKAKQHTDGHDVEVWQGARLVAYIVPEEGKKDDGMDP